MQSIARSQAQAGLSVTVACINHLGKDGTAAWNELSARTPYEKSTDGRVEVERFGKVASLWKFDFCSGISKFLRDLRENVDILHLHVPNPVFCLALARFKTKTPIVVTYHSDIVKQKLASIPFRLVENAVFKRVNKFIVATAEYARSSKTLQRYGDRLSIIPFGLDLSPYKNPSPAALAFRDKLLEKASGLPIWMCVGRFVYYKGFEHAIRALKQCPGRLIMVGDGPLNATLTSLAREIGVDDRIDWYRELSDDELVGAYHASRALWFPSVFRSEAFGLVQIEAMASGCPVINTFIEGSGVPAVSRDGESGITVKVGDAGALADAANRLYSNNDLWCQLANGARVRSQREFSLEVMTARTLQCYEEAIAAN